MLFWMLSLTVSLLRIKSILTFVQPEPKDVLFPPDTARIYGHNEPGSYFGYSVASYVGQSQPFCLVGAPRARRSIHMDFEGGINDGANVERTGSVYRIDLDPKQNYCSLVPIATTDAERKEYGTPTPGTSSWLGGSVAAASNSLNGVQLACDPRYLYTPVPINRTDSEEQPSTSDSAHVTSSHVGTGSCALYTGASMRYTSVDSCISQVEGACLAGFSADVQPGKQFGEALVVLGMPGSYLTEGNIFVGNYRRSDKLSASRLKNSPQDLKHMGFNLGYSVLLAKLIARNRTLEQREKRLSSRASREEWSVLASSPIWFDNDYRGIVMILNEALDLGGVSYLRDQWGHIGSFFGYSLATADLDGNGILDIIVGAPYYTENRYNDYNWRNGSMKSLRTASSFNTREVYPSSIVQDPSEKKTWRGLIPDVGKVYVFYGYPPSPDKSDRLPDYTSRDPLIITGLKSAGGRFGHAVVNLGDVDGDGTDDLAVSCPYCDDPKDRKDKGAVLVYLGNKGSLMRNEPFQVIWPADLSRTAPVTTCGDSFEETERSVRPFGSFGWSLSGGTDLDQNNVPDLIIGDYESDQIVLLRARNTLWFDSPEWDIPDARALRWIGPNETPCSSDCHFTVHLSVRVHGNQPQFRQSKLRVVVDLDAAMDDLVFKRLSGKNNYNQLNIQKPVAGVIETVVPVELLKDGDRINLVSLIVEPLPHRISSFIWKPVLINVTISPILDSIDISNDDPAITAWSAHPFLGQRSFVSRAMHFVNPACGSDHVCRADLQVRMIDLSEGVVNNYIIYYRERVAQRNLTVGVGNTGENAYAAQLRMTIPNQFSFIVPKGLNCHSEAINGKQVTQLLCDLGDPLGYTGNNFRPYVFQLNTAGAHQIIEYSIKDQPDRGNGERNLNESTGGKLPRMLSRPDSVEIIAEVLSGNADSDPRDNVARVEYKLQLAAKIGLSSSSVDRTTMDPRNFTVQLYEMQRVHPETLGPELKHIYLVSNDGPSPVTNLWVNVSIPLQTQAGEYLVYFLDRIRYHALDGGPPLVANMAPEVVSAEGHTRGKCYIPDWALNPLRLNAVHRGIPEDRSLTEINSKVNLRSRRSLDVDLSDRITVDGRNKSINQYPPRNVRSLTLNDRKRQQKIVKCGQDFADLGIPVCVTIKCRIDQLSRTDAVRIMLRGHVWADTFFRHKISDLAIVSEAATELPIKMFNIYVHGNRSIQPLTISQNFVFSSIKIPLFREIPIWPIILGCILGAVLLGLIIFGMWRCGFFRRKRWYDRPQPNSLSVSPEDL